jgi:hypothetical protein
MEIKAITRQHRATADQRMRMVEQFRRSGLTRAAFSQQYGIPLATLNWWLAKVDKKSIRRISRGFSNPLPIESLSISDKKLLCKL